MFCNDMTQAQAEGLLDLLGEDSWPSETYFHTEWEYDHPALVAANFVVCERRAILPAAWQGVFAELFASGRIIHLDAGHQLMVTRPEALAAILLLEAHS